VKPRPCTSQPRGHVTDQPLLKFFSAIPRINSYRHNCTKIAVGRDHGRRQRVPGLFSFISVEVTYTFEYSVSSNRRALAHCKRRVFPDPLFWLSGKEFSSNLTPGHPATACCPTSTEHQRPHHAMAAFAHVSIGRPKTLGRQDLHNGWSSHQGRSFAAMLLLCGLGLQPDTQLGHSTLPLPCGLALIPSGDGLAL
jgi:hypothetical protein